jgi:hypothetical protein
VSKADEYQKLAAECLLLAKTMGNQTNRTILLQMATTWLNLAERAITKPREQTEAQDFS